MNFAIATNNLLHKSVSTKVELGKIDPVEIPAVETNSVLNIEHVFTSVATTRDQIKYPR